MTTKHTAQEKMQKNSCKQREKRYTYISALVEELKTACMKGGTEFLSAHIRQVKL